jgi:hypothetical protein
MIDGLQERLQVGLGPRLVGGRDQDQGEMGAVQADGQGVVETLILGSAYTCLHRPVHRDQMIDEGRDDRRGAVERQVGEQDDADAGVGQRVALEVAEEGVVEFLARRHSCSRRRGPGPSIGR